MVLGLKWNKKYSLQTKFSGNWIITLFDENVYSKLVKRLRIKHPRTPKFYISPNFKQTSVQNKLYIKVILNLIWWFSFDLFQAICVTSKLFHVRLLINTSVLATINQLKLQLKIQIVFEIIRVIMLCSSSI